MGKQSTRENKTIYQLCREAAGLTRAEASERMDAVFCVPRYRSRKWLNIVTDSAEESR